MTAYPIRNGPCIEDDIVRYTKSHLLLQNFDDEFAVNNWYLCPLNSFNMHRRTIKPIILQNGLSSFRVNSLTMFSSSYSRRILITFITANNRQERIQFLEPFFRTSGNVTCDLCQTLCASFSICSRLLHASGVYQGP